MLFSNSKIHNDQSKGNVLVLDTQLRPSLAIIRSLGKKDIKVTTANEYSLSMGSLSKYCHQKYFLPNPKRNESYFIDSLIKILRNESFDCMFSSTTHTTYLLSKYKRELSNYTRIPSPSFEIFKNVYQKEKLLQIAQKNGISIPKIYDQDSETIEFPVIIKPLRRHAVGICISNSKQDLHKKLKNMTT